MSDVAKINIDLDSSSSNSIKRYTDGGTSNSFDGKYQLTEIDMDEMEKLKSDLEDMSILELVGDNISNVFSDIGDAFSDTLATVGNQIDSALSNMESSVSSFMESTISVVGEGIELLGNVINKTWATRATIVTSLVEGVLKLGESIVDLGAILGAGIVTAGDVLCRGVEFLGGLLMGKDTATLSSDFSEKVSDDLDIIWDSCKAFVSVKGIDTLFNEMYENTGYGKWLKNNSLFFDQVRTVSSGVGYVAGIVALTVATAGAGGAVVGASGGAAGAASGAAAGAVSTASSAGVSAAQLSVTAGLAGFGQGTESAWADGADTGEGLAYGALNGVWEGLQFYAGAKIGGTNIVGKGVTSQGTTNISAKALNSAGRIILDGLDGGVEGFVQPLLATTYKDGSYEDLFNEYGGWENVLTQATVGSVSSALGEAFDVGKNFANNKDTGKVDVNKIDANSEIRKNIQESSPTTANNVARNTEILELKNDVEIAKYFADPKGYMYARIKEIAQMTSDLDLKNQIENDLNILSSYCPNRMESSDIFQKIRGYLTENDRNIIDELEKIRNSKMDLTESQKALIEIYTRSDGPIINAYARKATCNFDGIIIDGTNVDNINTWLKGNRQILGLSQVLSKYNDVQAYIDAIDEMFKNAEPLKDNLKVYRGVNRDGIYIDGNSICIPERGTTFNDQGYVSTSLNRSHMAYKHDVILEIEVPKGTKALYLEPYSGVTGYGQQELLLDRDSMFRIKEICYTPIGDEMKMVYKVELATESKNSLESLNLDK